MGALTLVWLPAGRPMVLFSSAVILPSGATSVPSSSLESLLELSAGYQAIAHMTTDHHHMTTTNLLFHPPQDEKGVLL